VCIKSGEITLSLLVYVPEKIRFEVINIQPLEMFKHYIKKKYKMSCINNL